MATYTIKIEMLVDGPSPPEPPAVGPDCDEIGPATRINVTAYDRQRDVVVRLRRGEKRCLVVNFHGAIAIERTIARVDWHGWPRGLSAAKIVGREAHAVLDTDHSGRLLCIATLDNGERYTQAIRVQVLGDYYYPSTGFMTALP